ncbi:MAG TPA: SCO family protein [Candidatus Angelobacter sp.]
MNRRDLLTCHLTKKGQPAASLGPQYYSNGLFLTHEGKAVRFYDDLIKGKIAIINFFYASCEAFCPRTMACLAKVQDLLGDRLGRDMFMYSFTLKPEEDTPAKLKAYAKGIGAKPGWTLLTGNEYDLTTIRFKLFRLDDPLLDFSRDLHATELRIINDNNSQWTSWALPEPPAMIREAISWVEPLPPMEERIRHNAAVQRKVEKEMAILGPQRAAFKHAHGYSEVTEKRENPEGMKKLQALLAAGSKGKVDFVSAV